MTRIALATCTELPALDDDDQLIAPALEALGIEATPAIWDDPAVDWAAFDLVVIRNTWDYAGRREAFLAWARSVPRLVNPPDVLAWSTDKGYLAELREAGLPVVPTWFVEPGGELPELGELVVKPSVGVGSIGARRFGPGERGAAAAHARALEADGRVAMVQPYLRAVEDGRGETALIVLGGELSHAIHKGPLLGGEPAETFADGLYLLEQVAPREADAAERAVGARVHAWVTERFGPVPYARIDVVPHDDEPVVLEVELVEPSLFLGTAAGAPARLAAALAALVA